MHPTTPAFLSHFDELVMQHGPPEIRAYFQQLFRTVELPRWLRAAGLREVHQRPTFMLRQQPIDAYGRAFLTDLIKTMAPAVPNMPLPPEDKEVWRS